MSSTGANRESEGGTMKNVSDNQSTKPQSHSNAGQGNQEGAGAPGSTSHNDESPGGTFKNIIDDQSTKPQSHKHAEDQGNSNAGQGNNKCNSGGPDHKQGQNSCDSCQKK